MALYEAMSMGLVPVTVLSGGQRELVSSQCGHTLDIFKLSETQEISKYSQLLHDLILDSVKLKRRAAFCRSRIVNNFQFNDSASHFLNTLKSLSRSTRSRRSCDYSQADRIAATKHACRAVQSFESSYFKE
jgi:hypothetical protein